MASLLDALTPDTAEAVRLLVAYAATQGITLVPSSGKRSCAEQHALYAQGRTAPGPKVTNADGCVSWHVLGRAVDAYVTKGPKDYALLGAYWRSIGGVWGGDFTGAAAALQDFGHFEYHPLLKSASRVCTNPATCTIDAAANAPRVYPTPTAIDDDDSSDESSAVPLFLTAAALAAVAGYFFSKRKLPDMAFTDSEARAAFIAAAPVMADAAPRALQGLLAVSRTLNNYGYRFYAQPNETDHNWGAFATPAGVPCSPPTSYAVPLGGGTSLCLVSFPDDNAGVNTFIDAMSADPLISKAIVDGDVMQLADALRASPQFSQQSLALYGDDVHKLQMYLGLSIVAVAQAAGQAPDWYADGMRIDQALAQGGTDTPAGSGIPAGSGTPAGGDAAADDGMSIGKGLATAGVLGLLGYGLYKLAKRGPRLCISHRIRPFVQRSAKTAPPPSSARARRAPARAC